MHSRNLNVPCYYLSQLSIPLFWHSKHGDYHYRHSPVVVYGEIGHYSKLYILAVHRRLSIRWLQRASVPPLAVLVPLLCSCSTPAANSLAQPACGNDIAPSNSSTCWYSLGRVLKTSKNYKGVIAMKGEEWCNSVLFWDIRYYINM